MFDKLFLRQIESILKDTKFDIDSNSGDKKVGYFICSYDYEEYYFSIERDRMNRKDFLDDLKEHYEWSRLNINQPVDKFKKRKVEFDVLDSIIRHGLDRKVKIEKILQNE